MIGTKRRDTESAALKRLALHTQGCDFLHAQALSQATPVVKDAADTVAPYVKAGLQTASDVAGPALKAAEPVVQARTSGPCDGDGDGCDDKGTSGRNRGRLPGKGRLRQCKSPKQSDGILSLHCICD